MKNILQDKRYVILQALSAVAAVVYLILTNTYQHRLTFLFWVAALLLFAGCGIYCGTKKRWVAVSVNLAAVILVFMSLMFLPYSV